MSATTTTTIIMIPIIPATGFGHEGCSASEGNRGLSAEVGGLLRGNQA